MKADTDLAGESMPLGTHSSPHRICYVLSYHAPDYIRTQSLLRALSGISEIDLYLAINEARGASRYAETLLKVRKIRDRYQPDIYVLGFRGHELYWPLRWLVGKKPIIFDALMSPYSALREERKHGFFGVVAAMLWRPVEGSILNDAEMILTDTESHANYYAKTFMITREKIAPMPVGAIETRMTGMVVLTQPVSDDELKLLFYGSFLPLHGIDVIIKAATLLQDLPIRFDFIGGGERAGEMLRQAFPSTGIVKYTHRKWLKFDELITEAIPGADLCLGGPFGNTPQAKRVVTGKTSQCLSLGKPTVIGDIDEDYGFRDRENCLLVEQGDAESLAKSIRWAWENRSQLADIGIRGQSIYMQSLSIRCIRNVFAERIASL